jgi:hypothetical protein
LRSKSIALVLERSGGVVVGDAIGKVVGRGELEGWGAELGRRGDGRTLFEDLGLGGEVGVGVDGCESAGDMCKRCGRMRWESRAGRVASYAHELSSLSLIDSHHLLP